MLYPDIRILLMIVLKLGVWSSPVTFEAELSGGRRYSPRSALAGSLDSLTGEGIHRSSTQVALCAQRYTLYRTGTKYRSGRYFKTRRRAMPITEYAAFEALDPFFHIVQKGLKEFVDGEHYFDTLADNASFEFRYKFPGWPQTVRGRSDLMELYAGYGKNIR